MENREYQILSEIREMISSVRAQLDALEAKVAQLSQDAVTEVVDDTPIDLDIEDVFDDIPVVEPAAEAVEEVVAETVTETIAEVVEEVVEDSVAETVPEVVEDSVEETVPEVDDDLPFEEEDLLVVEDDIPAVEEEDLPAAEMLIDAAVANAKPTVIDAMTARQAWRTAIPGSQVRDIRSAISLHDRILFINGLFDEDPMLFQEVLTAINSMSSVDEVVEYLGEKRPDWNMESDEVYRFMMAVRRRIQ